MNKLLKSVLKTVVYLIDQTEGVAGDARSRVSDTVDRASDRASDLRDRAYDLLEPEDHTLRNVLTFVAGVGVGVGAALLLAPASGEEIRGQIGEKVQDISERVRDRFTSELATPPPVRKASAPRGRFSRTPIQPAKAERLRRFRWPACKPDFRPANRGRIQPSGD